MNRFFLWLMWGMLLSMLSVVFATPMSDISALEQQLWFWSADMYMTPYFYDLIEWTKKACPVEQITKAQGYAAGMRASLIKKYASMTQWEQLNETLKLYNRLMKAHTKLSVLPESYYCILKYVVLDVQDMLRQKHIGIMESTWIIKDFEWFANGWTIQWYVVKKELMQSYLDAYAGYDQKLWTSLQFSTKTLSGLSSERQEIADMSTELMKRAVYKSLYELKTEWFLSSQDIDLLKDKFELKQEQSCGAFHGNYSVTETFDHLWNQVDLQPVSVPLSVNVCGNYFLLKELDLHYRKIIVHEMGHHYYYFNARSVANNFGAVCWVDEKSQNGQCSDANFVSSYAQTNMLEDYADHFMHWFLDIVPEEHDNHLIDKKSAYFESL